MPGRAVMVVIDGLGFNAETEGTILRRAWETIGVELRGRITRSLGAGEYGAMSEFDAFLVATNRNPRVSGTLQRSPAVGEDLARSWLHMNGPLVSDLKRHVSSVAAEFRYAPWVAETPCLDVVRTDYPTAATKASGLEAGYEDLDPEVQGNSETGHQQLGNLTVAPQVPLQIAIDIETGRFFENSTLIEAVEVAKRDDVQLVVSFMISGEFGDDGRVHSCWSHLEAFFELAFERLHLRPKNLLVQAILDGRDSPSMSSVARPNGRPGFLFLLRDLLDKYGARESLAWIVGRGIAMDRDYEESRTRADYELLFSAKGRPAASFDDAVEVVRQDHERQALDPFVPPIVVLSEGHARSIGANDVVLDLNFRADRQRARVASWLGAREFLAVQAGAKGQTWSLDWLTSRSPRVYCLTEYHPELERLGARVIYPVEPQPHNFLNLLRNTNDSGATSIQYLLVAESTKAVHLGYFIRGRREAPPAGIETRFVIPSYAQEAGILTDDDYYKTPQMRAYEVAGKLLNELSTERYGLAIVNLSNPDMIGHLSIDHFDAVVQAMEHLDSALGTIITYCQRRGYYTIVTADHGCVEEYSSSHSSNPVASSFIHPDGAPRLTLARNDLRLFDIPWAIIDLLGVTEDVTAVMPPIPAWISTRGLVGSSPLAH
jgi:2,3-bisphosphoglycerate-independent phosphoglycerate mutase